MKKLNQVGDTIVEVLLALTILAMTIGTAYAISNKSTKRAQQAQERTQATRLVEGQIDRLKYLSESSGLTDITAFKQAKDTSKQCISFIGGSIQAVPFNDPTNGDSCKDGVFEISFTYNSNNSLFKVMVEWFSLSGSSEKENVIMEYRVVQ